MSLLAPAPTDTAWQTLTDRIASVLAILDEDDSLIIAGKRQYGFVRFLCQGRHGMRALALGNYYLEPEWKLDDNQLARLALLGWSAPTASEPSPEWIESDPDFVPWFHVETADPVPFIELAELAAATLRDVYRLHHPSVLEYDAVNGRTRIKLPTLGLMASPPRPPAPQQA